MRLIFALPLLLVGGCNVENDPRNDQVTLEYNEQQIENTAEDVGNTAENIGAAIVNEAEDTAERIDNSGIVADGNDSATQNAQ